MSEHVDHNSALQAAIMLAEECLEDALADKLRAAAAELERLEELERANRDVHNSHSLMVRRLDTALNGEGAARQASLCDIVQQMESRPAVPAEVEELVARIAGWTCDCEYRNGEKCDACEARDVLAKHGEGEG